MLASNSPVRPAASEYRDFYFSQMNLLLESTIDGYCKSEGLSPSTVDSRVAQHIVDTAHEYTLATPQINYSDPLCRMGYLYSHVGINAFCFEKSLQQLGLVEGLLAGRDGEDLSICAIGGGPGTELLGLAKTMLYTKSCPRKIRFFVVDRVIEWAETWSMLSSSCQEALNREGLNVIISDHFLPLDVRAHKEFRKQPQLIRNANLFVFNYLLSENKAVLDSLHHTVNYMASNASPNSHFVFIDRRETSTGLHDRIRQFVGVSGLKIVRYVELGGRMSDNESALGEFPARFGNRHPRSILEWSDSHKGKAFAILATNA